MIDKRILAQHLRGAENRGINITIKLDTSSLAQAIKQAQLEDDYQKTDGYSPNVSG